MVLYGSLGTVGMWLYGPVLVFADRILLGGATALIMAGGTALISEFYEGHARLSMIARQGMAIELGGVIFLFVGGLLAVRNWQWPFLLYLVAWVFLVMVLAFVPRRPGRTEAPEEVGTAPVASKLNTVYLAAALSMVAFFTGVIMLPVRLHALGLDEAQTGYFLSFISLIAVGAAFLMPRLTRASSESGVLMAGFLAYSGAHALFASSGALNGFLLGGVLMGVGFGLTVPLVNHMTVERSRARQRGRNLAQLSMAIFLGQFLSSFMELIPGSTAVIFATAAIAALLVAVLLASLRLVRRGTLA